MVKLPYTKMQARSIKHSPEWEAVQARVRAWQKVNRDKVNANSRAWRERNREAARASVRRSEERPGYRRARKLARRVGCVATPEALAYVQVLVGDPCCYCGEPMEQVDHIVPVGAGGDGSWENLTAACGSCNRSKSARPLLVFLAER